jgi:hypothetical protein
MVKILERFINFEKSYKEKNINRRNYPRYSFLLLKICEQCNCDVIIDIIPKIKGKNKLEEYENIWNICNN